MIVPIPLPVFKRLSFYLDAVNLVANRSTCRPDRKAGAIIVDSDYRIVSMGYNGTPPGVPHCLEKGCMIYEGHCIGTLHAEMNALANLKVKENHLLMICSLQPCLYCLKMLMSFKIEAIMYTQPYKDSARDFFMATCGGRRIESSAVAKYGIELKDRWLLPGGTELLRVMPHSYPLFKGDEE